MSKHRVALVALGLLFVVALVTSTGLLSFEPTPPGAEFTWYDGTHDGTWCDSAGLTVLGIEDAWIGDTPASPAVEALCDEAALVPGIAGLLIELAGLAAGIGWILLYLRGLSRVLHGEPISTAARRV